MSQYAIEALKAIINLTGACISYHNKASIFISFHIYVYMHIMIPYFKCSIFVYNSLYDIAQSESSIGLWKKSRKHKFIVANLFNILKWDIPTYLSKDMHFNFNNLLLILLFFDRNDRSTTSCTHNCVTEHPRLCCDCLLIWFINMFHKKTELFWNEIISSSSLWPQYLAKGLSQKAFNDCKIGFKKLFLEKPLWARFLHALFQLLL